MIKMGALPIADEIAPTRALCGRFHPEVAFIADANQGWSEAEARRFIEGVADCPLTLLEQPVGRDEVAALARLRAAASFPLSADESLFYLDQAARLARQGAVDVFSLKLSKNGGIRPTQRIAHLAQGFGIDCLMNSMLECGVSQAASLQLGCTLPNLLPCGHAYMSTLRLADDVTDFSSLVRDGIAHLPDRLGLGIEVDSDKVAALALVHERVGPGQAITGTAA
jgi:muconate cycloisomerase